MSKFNCKTLTDTSSIIINKKTRTRRRNWNFTTFHHYIEYSMQLYSQMYGAYRGKKGGAHIRYGDTWISTTHTHKHTHTHTHTHNQTRTRKDAHTTCTLSHMHIYTHTPVHTPYYMSLMCAFPYSFGHKK